MLAIPQRLLLSVILEISDSGFCSLHCYQCRNFAAALLVFPMGLILSNENDFTMILR